MYVNLLLNSFVCVAILSVVPDVYFDNLIAMQIFVFVLMSSEFYSIDLPYSL